MSYRLPRRDARFLKLAYTVGNVMGVVPSYDFEKGEVVHPSRDRIWAVVLVSLMSSGTAYSLYNRSIYFAAIYPTTQSILDYMNEFLLVMTDLVVVVGSNFCNREAWVKLNNNLQLVDRRLGQTAKPTGGFLGNSYLHWAIAHVLFLGSCIFTVQLWIKTLGDLVLRTYTVHEICYYYSFFTQFLMYDIAGAFEWRYKDLNACLEKLSSPACKAKTLYMRQVGSLSRLLGETICSFNEIFGWPMVFIAARNVVQVLLSLNFMIFDVSIQDEGFKRDLFIANIYLVALIAISVALITAACSRTMAESRRTVFLCNKLQESFAEDSKERHELLLLARHAASNGAKFSAADFFEINRSTLLGFLGTTTTYFIVVIQFNWSFGSK